MEGYGKNHFRFCLKKATISGQRRIDENFED
jgi:hypothetical protein